jgi:hypothetical protein
MQSASKLIHAIGSSMVSVSTVTLLPGGFPVKI